MMFQIQSVARIIFGLIGDCGCWVEDKRDNTVNPVFHQIKSGIVLKVSSGFPYSIISPFGEWVIVGKTTGSPDQRLLVWNNLINLVSLSLLPVKGNPHEFSVKFVEGEEIETVRPFPHKGEFLPSKVCIQRWNQYLGIYFAGFADTLVGRQVEIKSTVMGGILRTTSGVRMRITSISPQGLVEAVDQKGNTHEGIPAASLVVFRDGLVP